MEEAKKRGGYLVNINDDEEFSRIKREIIEKGYEKIQFRLGGRRDYNERLYYWIDENNHLIGNPLNVEGSWCIDEWLSGEPTYEYDGVYETCLDMYMNDVEWVWSDVPDNMIETVPEFSGKLGYIIEFDE